MGSGCACVCLFLSFFSSIVTADYAEYQRLSNRLNKTRNVEIDLLLEDLQQAKWDQDDIPCFRTLIEIIYGVKNSTLWATWIWDSMQRPTGALYGSQYQLGNFDQCVNPPWRQTHKHLRTQHCLVEISLTDTVPVRWHGHPDPYGSTENYINTTSKYGRHLNTLSVGVCIPEMCSRRAASTMAMLMMRYRHLPTPRDPVVLSCQKGDDTHQYSVQFYLFVITFGFLYALAIFVSLFPEYLPSTYWVSEIRKAFDMKRNWLKLFEVSKSELRSIHGIRCINATLIIGSHYLYYANLAPIFNSLHVERDLDSSVGMFYIPADLIVDTFFAISGMLLVNGLMSGKRKNLVEGLIKRYIRIIGPLAVMVYYFSWVHEHMGSGPVWEHASGEQRDVCHKNWWATLFMINNYVNEDQICHTVTWYLACDFQLAIFGTFIYYLYQRDKKTGKIVIAISTVAAVLIPSIVTYYYKLSPLFFHDVHGMVNFKTDVEFIKRYVKAHCRAAVYFVGMYTGYLFAVYKPEDYKNKLSKTLSILGFLATFSIMVTVYRGSGLMFFREYNALEVAAFVVFNKVAWAFAVCCLIAICEYGTLPLISTYLKWDFFVPLSRLSYCVYITHMAVIYYSIHGARVGIRYDFLNMAMNALGIWIVTNWFSVGLWLVVEAPISNLLYHLFNTRITEKTEAKSNGHAEINGYHIFKVKST